MHNSTGNGLIFYLSCMPMLQWNHIYIQAFVIHGLISPDVKKTEAAVNNHFWQSGLFSPSYLWAGRNSWGWKLIWSAPNVITAPPKDSPMLLHLFPALVWKDKNTLLICSVLVLWRWNQTHPPCLMTPCFYLRRMCAWCVDSSWALLTSPVLSADVGK